MLVSPCFTKLDSEHHPPLRNGRVLRRKTNVESIMGFLSFDDGTHNNTTSSWVLISTTQIGPAVIVF